jgi:hypothetical protein|tara:strand:+ start:350 stop:889 length:540 start_codon:yes stop_codon:yes gene_type:complete
MSILKVNSIQPFSGGSVKITGNSVISGSFSGSFEGSFDGNTGFEDITNKPTLISGSNQLAGTSVNGNLTINSELKILSSSLLYGQNTDIDGEEVVLSRATGSHRSVFYDYVMTSESHARAGTVMAVWYGGVVNYADTSTADIGDTSEVTLSVALSGNNVNLQASGSINNWSIKTTSKLI